MRYMPARNPEIPPTTEKVLATIGGALRARRLDLGISAVTTAEAAGMSRVTLHRIESGAPSVTIGAYLNAATALGLQLAVVEPGDHSASPTPSNASGEEATARIGDYRQLSAIAWQLHADTEISELDALRLYERNWRHVDQSAMSDEERAFVQRLADAYSGGVLLV